MLKYGTGRHSVHAEPPRVVSPPVIACKIAAAGAVILLSLSNPNDVALARPIDGAPIVQDENRCSISAFDKVVGPCARSSYLKGLPIG